ncbi:ALPHA/BETA HYDROLASE FOLD-CONTAINING PROTEIN [Ceraceosorus bombacis]|uniref:ALPHA/BETA HYDROLASE FOLD-CONTAINING PROTEIN n=1 Tax=Ceraceosorus bombacis TaxID=401625 RepID=A0A0P1BBJ0_9BASI|nr:ALPHA/BETA HYDROLASE FOLD-CONTAINING PROTEIN [Ceraceosorus bombacis]
MLARSLTLWPLALTLGASLASAAVIAPGPSNATSSGQAISTPELNEASKAGPLGLDNVNCQDVTIHAKISAQNIDFVNVDDNYNNASYVTDTLLAFTQRQKNWTAAHMPGTKHTNNATYRIAAHYCEPKRGAVANSSLLVATHGIGFDSSYWNYSYKKSYSFVRHAASHGYSSLIYDRLGTGESETPSKGGFNTVQAPTEVAILTQILTQAKQTKNIGGKKHARIVAIGHSYGSAQSQAVTASSPDLIDGVVLTGFSTATQFTGTFILSGAYTQANSVSELSLKDKSGIWLASASKVSNVQNFIDPSNADSASIDLARKTEQPVTLGAYASLASISAPASNFTKPVLVLNGDHDLPFCGADCQSQSPAIPDGVKMLYPAASNFTSELIPLTGHGIVPHRTGPESHEITLQWIIDNKL